MGNDVPTPGDRIRQVREQAGLTQRRLSALIGAPDTYVWSVERGVEPGARYLVRLAQTLGVTAEWIVTGAGEGPGPVKTKRAVEAAERALAGGAP